jgi:hypothetical protein
MAHSARHSLIEAGQSVSVLARSLPSAPASLAFKHLTQSSASEGKALQKHP